MHNALNLLLRQPFAMAQFQYHRSGSRFLVLEKERFFRHHNMHTAAVDFVEPVDGSYQFTLKRSLIVYVLGKLAHAEFGIVKKLKTDAAALGQALGG